MSDQNYELALSRLATREGAEQFVGLLSSDEQLRELAFEALSDSKRRVRQAAAAALHALSKEKPELLSSGLHHIVDALHRPEAQTRWEILAILMNVELEGDKLLSESFEGALESLYDEDSNLVHLAAFNYLLKLARKDHEWLARVWVYIDEAIQCYHGDSEFSEMLKSLHGFVASGALDTQTAQALLKRLEFDAEQGKGYIKRASKALCELLAKQL